MQLKTGALAGRNKATRRSFPLIFLNSSFACFARPTVSSLIPSLVPERPALQRWRSVAGAC